MRTKTKALERRTIKLRSDLHRGLLFARAKTGGSVQDIADRLIEQGLRRMGLWKEEK